MEGQMNLGQACKDGNLERVKACIAEGADVNANNCKDGENALVRALNGPDETMVAIVTVLLEAGADPE
jgi:ankyrin repeat protein